jgi:nicotinamide-nucleotide amidase
MTTRRFTPGAELKGLCLAEPALTLAIAESITAGHVQAQIASVSGASGFFLGGITAYTLAQKVKHLGVGRVAAKRVNAVSAEVAAQMARGVAELFGSDVGLATTGYAEKDKAYAVTEPYAHWALAHRVTARRWEMRTGLIVCPGLKRVEVQSCVAEVALAELVAYLCAWREGNCD